MANLTRYDRPYSLARMDPFAEFDDLFKGFLVHPLMESGQQQMQIRMDVKENENAYTVHADIPGVKKEDIQVSIEGNEVSISAETRSEKDVKDGDKMLRSERYVGKVSRTFSLTHEVDEAQAQAKYTDGVLELTLPKKATTAAKKLTIQ